MYLRVVISIDSDLIKWKIENLEYINLACFHKYGTSTLRIEVLRRGIRRSTLQSRMKRTDSSALKGLYPPVRRETAQYDLNLISSPEDGANSSQGKKEEWRASYRCAGLYRLQKRSKRV